MSKTNKRIMTAEIKFYCEPELKEQIAADLGLVSLSAWMRDAAAMKLKLGNATAKGDA